MEVSNQIYPYSMLQNYNETKNSLNTMLQRALDRESGTGVPNIFNQIKTSLSLENPKQYIKEKIW